MKKDKKKKYRIVEVVETNYTTAQPEKPYWVIQKLVKTGLFKSEWITLFKYWDELLNCSMSKFDSFESAENALKVITGQIPKVKNTVVKEYEV